MSYIDSIISTYEGLKPAEYESEEALGLAVDDFLDLVTDVTGQDEVEDLIRRLKSSGKITVSPPTQRYEDLEG